MMRGRRWLRTGGAKAAAGRSRGGRRARGFSLLEVLVALLVLALGAASVLSLFAGAASTHRRSVDRTHAALVAERVIAAARGRYVRGTRAEALSEELERELPELFGDYRWEVELVRPGAEPDGRERRGTGRRGAAPGDEAGGPEAWSEDELFVRVSVRWKRSGHDRSERFWTILLPRGGGEGSEEPAHRPEGLIRRR